MKQDYTDIVEDLSQRLSVAIQEREINLDRQLNVLKNSFFFSRIIM